MRSAKARPNIASLNPALRAAFQAYANANSPASPVGEPLLSWSDNEGKGHLYSDGLDNWFWLEGEELRTFVPWQALDGIYRWRFGSPYAVGALPASDTSGLQLETISGLVTWLDSRYLDLKKAEELLRGLLGNRWSELYHDTPRLWTTGFDGTAGKHKLLRGQEPERGAVPLEPGDVLMEEPAASVHGREKRARVVSASMLVGGLAVLTVGVYVSQRTGFFFEGGVRRSTSISCRGGRARGPGRPSPLPLQAAHPLSRARQRAPSPAPMGLAPHPLHSFRGNHGRQGGAKSHDGAVRGFCHAPRRGALGSRFVFRGGRGPAGAQRARNGRFARAGAEIARCAHGNA